jgi:hypothetical protein
MGRNRTVAANDRGALVPAAKRMRGMRARKLQVQQGSNEADALIYF